MNLSSTQVSKFKRCQRAYALEYVENRKPPPSPKQQFGKDVHTKLENWLRDAKKPDDSPEGMVAKQGIRNNWLPAPSSKLLVEHEFSIPWLDGDVFMIGFVDCVVPGEIPILIDHKTTSNLSWAMTTEQLVEDPQALIYSIWGALKYKSPLIKARWVYYSASNPRSGARKPTGALPVEIEFEVNKEPYLSRVRDLVDTTRQMVWIRKNEVRGEDCPANPKACKDYGGCWHRGKECQLTPDEIIEGNF